MATEETNRERKSCCVADAMWRIGQVEVAGRTVGIINLGEIIEGIRALELGTEEEIRAEFLRRVRGAHYVPRGLDDAYADAVLSKFREWSSSQKNGCCGR